ncbi:prepilin peptidase-dependent [Clostridium perfringens]|uniref:Prepilin peptidase-dependent n=1 Tax=Clostridium perfringens TaxID=1502 RepID=A0A2X3C2X4_CLOPF|nr:prepilin-type N-terminal cleavage/methylation domain-containing protein [Clostridium perfringens]UBK55360.1 prepilin-type N-terminal cleavage/methylation domain-containing protein [Clostridium perfringens]SQC06254.1 prepilin peptidase-dependent [Clostridium perfringens]STB56887.1 prepilin peptidase-dependent [Clostridium perfringens]
MNTKKQNKKKKGFTLIELIIVIAIIAILAAIAIPNFLGIQRKSKIKADIASAKTIYDGVTAGIAEGKIVPSIGTETFILNPSASGSKAEVTASGTATQAMKNNAAELQGYLQTIPEPKFKSGKFIVTIASEKNLVKPVIKVGIGETTIQTEVYPGGKDEYAINNVDGKATEKPDSNVVNQGSDS